MSFAFMHFQAQLYQAKIELLTHQLFSESVSIEGCRQCIVGSWKANDSLEAMSL